MSTTTTSTFTITNARYLASKITADLRQFKAFYGEPTEEKIEELYEELVEMLAGGYVATYEAGFRKDGKRVVSQRYIVSSGAAADERAGGIYARADVSGASWFTFMTYSSKWEALTPTAQQAVKDTFPIKRTRGSTPTDGDGYWETGRSYESGGTSTARSGFRPT
jgi:Bacterial HORMA domain family 1